MRLGQLIYSMMTGSIPLQRVVSIDLLDTLRRVLPGQGWTQEESDEFAESLADMMRAGPEALDPVMVLGGREQFAMRDAEDAGILAACFALRVRLLVTDNLKDFVTAESERMNTREVRYQSGAVRQLYALVHEREAEDLAVIVMHPLDAIDFLEDGVWPTAPAIRARYR